MAWKETTPMVFPLVSAHDCVFLGGASLRRLSISWHLDDRAILCATS